MSNAISVNGDCGEQREQVQSDVSMNADQECRHRELLIARMSGMKVLEAIGASFPAKFMRHDLQFLSELLISALDLRRIKVLIRLHGIKRTRDAAAPAKMLVNSIQKMEERELRRLLVEVAILVAARTETAIAVVLQDAAQFYGVDVESISAKVRRQVAKNLGMVGGLMDSAQQQASANRSAAA